MADGGEQSQSRGSSRTHLVIRRRAAAVLADGSREIRWLEDWRLEPAYVLLGDPGAGKSWSLKREANEAGGEVVAAEVFQAGLVPPTAGDTVFIDALDEARGGSGPDALTGIAQQLLAHGKPNFRITCREADWRQESDRRLLERVSPSGSVTTLHLVPLEREEILELLSSYGTKAVLDPDKFMAAADKHGVTDLLGNPLLLDLVVDAVATNGGRWPETRASVYESACRSMARERSLVHLERSPLSAGQVDAVLHDSGLLCALIILTASRAVTVSGAAAQGEIDPGELPRELPFEDVGRALKSKIFTVESGRAIPRHRTVAEYLGALAIARSVREGRTSLARVLATVQSFDGKPVESLRGLFGWLAVHLIGDERLLILDADPLAFVLNGDPASLTPAEARRLLQALERSAAENPWFRAGQWNDDPFGPLARPELASEFERVIRQPDRSEAHQAFLDCVLGALEHAKSPLPQLSEQLERMVVDPTLWTSVRLSAIAAWLRHCAKDGQRAKVLEWLDAAEADALCDEQDRLLGRLLRVAYPTFIQERVLAFLRPLKPHRLIAEFSEFWSYRFIRSTPVELLPRIADVWVERFPSGIPDDWRIECQGAADELLLATLKNFGDLAATPRLYAWLSVGMGEHGSMPGGDANVQAEIRSWLQERPERLKELFEYGCMSRPAGSDIRPRIFFQVEERLRGAQKPADWVRWLMSSALKAAGDAQYARLLTQEVAGSAWLASPGADAPTSEEIESWVRQLAVHHPAAPAWLVDAWCWPIEDWRREDADRRREHRAQVEAQRQERQQVFAEIFGSPKRFHDRLLGSIAHAYYAQVDDVARGDTAEARILALLQKSSEALPRVWQEIDSVLSVDRIPTVEKILDVAAQSREFYIAPAVMLAAERALESDPNAWTEWPGEVLDRVLAIALTGNDRTGIAKTVASGRPEVFARVLRQLYARFLASREDRYFQALDVASSSPELTRVSLLPLTAVFPARLRPWAARQLDRLFGAIARLPASEVVPAIEERLAVPRLDRFQRISLFLALLRYEPERISQLEDLVRSNVACISHLGEAIGSQRILSSPPRLPPQVIAKLALMLAKVTPNDEHWEGGWVTPLRQRQELLGSLVNVLTQDPTPGGRQALEDLEQAPQMQSWKAGSLSESIPSSPFNARRSIDLRP